MCIPTRIRVYWKTKTPQWDNLPTITDNTGWAEIHLCHGFNSHIPSCQRAFQQNKLCRTRFFIFQACRYTLTSHLCKAINSTKPISAIITFNTGTDHHTICFLCISLKKNNPQPMIPSFLTKKTIHPTINVSNRQFAMSVRRVTNVHWMLVLLYPLSLVSVDACLY